MSEDVLLIISNLAFFAPAYKAHELNRRTRSIIYTFMVFASAFYHACNSYLGLCLFSPNVQRKVDFFFAQWLIVITALYIIKFPVHLYYIERWLIFVAALGIFIVEFFYNEPFALQLIIVGLSVAAIVIYWICFAVAKAQCGENPRIPFYNWGHLIFGVSLTALACVLFTVQSDWHLGYPYVHSVWHVLAALGQYFILCSRDAGDKYANLDEEIVFFEKWINNIYLNTRQYDSDVFYNKIL